MPEKKRFLIIDGHALIHRAFHALPSLTTKKGELVNAVYGFLLVLFKAIRELQPDFIAATFDLPLPTFRHKQFKEYKAKRPKAPEELTQQIPRIKEVLRVFNIPIFEKQGFEADDIIGTISKKSPRKQIFPPVENIILSGDLDTLQLIDKNTKVFTLKKGLKDTILYDEEAVKERYNLDPSQLVDFKALRGDPSDNIPGVPGIGEKTAIKLIKQFGTLENLYEKIQDTRYKIQDTLKAKLLDYKDQAFFSKMLGEIKKDVPIDFRLKDCQWQEYDKEKTRKTLENLEFYSLINKLPEPQKEETEEEPDEKTNLKIW